MKLDLKLAAANLEALHAAEEKLADRGPIKVLPRPADQIPNVPLLQARIADLLLALQVKRGYAVAKGHDLDGAGNPHGYNLAAVGIIDEIKTVEKGRDRANPNATTLVRVGFPSGEHLWFDPADLVYVKKAKPKGAG